MFNILCVLGNLAAACAELSQLGIPSCNLRGAFPAWDSFLQPTRSFPNLGFFPAACAELSRLGIPSCNLREAFPAWE